MIAAAVGPGAHRDGHRHLLHAARAGHAELEAPGWLTPAASASRSPASLLAWLTYQRRAINADALAAVFAPIRAAALAKFWIDDLFEASTGYVLLGFSRVVGWIDRYLVDGVLNVVSAWTLDGGDGLRRIQTGKVQDYVYGVGPACSRSWRGSEAAGDAGCPILSIITWAPFVRALVIMFAARHRPLLVRLDRARSARPSRWSLSLWVYCAYDRAAAGFQFRE